MHVRSIRQRHDRLDGNIVMMMIVGHTDSEQGRRLVSAVMTVGDPLRHRSKGHDRQHEQQHPTHHDGVASWQATESAKGWHGQPTMLRTRGKGNRGPESTLA
ncbi:MAG TPA: hypothetical protein VIL60_09870 [Rhodanobacter sp.]